MDEKPYSLIVLDIPESKLQNEQKYSLRSNMSFDVMSQVNAVDIVTWVITLSLKNYPSSTRGLRKCPLPLRFSRQNFKFIFLMLVRATFIIPSSLIWSFRTTLVGSNIQIIVTLVHNPSI